MQNNNTSEVFYSKVMLFGEYTIIQGSMGLTIPYAHFNGELRMINKNAYTDLNYAKRSNKELQDYARYIGNLKNNNELPVSFDVDGLMHDLKKGLYFESSIPEGYGLGSSGALVAALYSRYVAADVQPHAGMHIDAILKLKHLFARLESYFHGTSSGIDPLICYLKHPIHLVDIHTIRPITIPRKEIKRSDAIFLINTGQAGKTGPLVTRYLERYQKPEFAAAVENELIPLTNNCIRLLLNGRTADFMEQIHHLSVFQLEWFREMIPEQIVTAWQQGIASQIYSLKLCGSGGGGYMLGFTRDYPQAAHALMLLGLNTIPVYSPSVGNY